VIRTGGESKDQNAELSEISMFESELLVEGPAQQVPVSPHLFARALRLPLSLLSSRVDFKRTGCGKTFRVCLREWCLHLAKAFVFLLCFSMFSPDTRAQPKSELAPPPPLDPAEGERQARELVSRLLEQRPDHPATNTGVLKIRDAGGNQHEVPARFDIVPSGATWLNVYKATSGTAGEDTTLTIVHSDAQSNQYFLSESAGAVDTNATPRKLVPGELMRPFAGSDFWIADLGLEFLHWPQQRVLRKQMRKGQSCDVLQSSNPQPVPGGYSRVVSWIAINRPEDIVIVHAEAFDAQNKLLKEFDPKKVEKINGVWQLEEMEIRNRQTGTRTRIDFNLDSQ
jgi:hypothetical protein